MLVLSGLVYASVLLQAHAVSPEAYIYTSKIQGSTLSHKKTISISSVTTRLLLAQRLGLSQYHSLQDADDFVIELLNGVGGAQEQIFHDQDGERKTDKLLAFIENVEHLEDLVKPQTLSPAFIIQDPPLASQNMQLALDMLDQDRRRRSKDASLCALEAPKAGGLRGGINSEGNARKQCALETSYPELLKGSDTIEQLESFISVKSSAYGSTAIFHISILEGLTHEDGSYYTKAVDTLASFIHHCLEAPESNQESTIILMPPHSTTSKRTSGSSYGAYTTPSRPLQPRQRGSEQPLSSVPEISSNTALPSSLVPLKAVPLVRGILPICHPSLKESIAATNNCSGHGIPYEKYGEPGSKEAQHCFACKCSTTVRTNDDGSVKTTHWGGPACQKKDVSVPFWLLAGFSIALIMTLSWAIGLLFSIGQEDLPGVIAAGVAGPRAQK